MSLKAVHLFFVTVLTTLCCGMGVTKLRAFQATGERAELWWGVGALLTAIVVLVYGRYFLKKLKKYSYL